MNKNSEQIRNEVNEMCKKYEIKRGMFMWLEKDEDGKWEKHRFILFEPGVKDFVVCQFADLFNKCMKVSNTLKNIMEHMAEHYLHDAHEMGYINRLMQKQPSKRTVN